MTDGEIGTPDGGGEEWWRKPAPPPAPPAAPPRIPGPRTDPPPNAGDPPGGSPQPPPPPADGTQDSGWFDGVRSQWQSDQDGMAAASAVGAQIGEAISSHLGGAQASPPPTPRKLDLRWLLLKYNIPGILLALLVTWRGHTGTGGMADFIHRDGLFAPLGAVVFVVLLIGILMVLPVGAFLGEAVSHLIAWLTTGFARLIARAWSTRYTGYVLRVGVAVVVWSFVLAVGEIAGRGLIHVLTGA